MAHNWDPLRDLLVLQGRMNRLFEDAARQPPQAEAEEEAAEVERADWQPAADVYEQENSLVIALDLPGIRREALDISVDEGRLTIQGERQAESDQLRRAERPAGRFRRSFVLPPEVEQGKISADYKEGVLRVRLPRRAEPQARRVEIKVS